MKDGRRVGGEGSENATDSASKLQIKQEEKSRKKEKWRRKRKEADLPSPPWSACMCKGGSRG
jgi:hypothetical protein